MIVRKFITLLTCLLFFSIALSGQNLLSTQGKAIVNESGDTIILRGMGLGGWMLQEGYMLQTAGFASAQHQIRNKIEELIGETATNEFYDAWLANHVRQIDIDSLKAWGFNSVRLPMHYNLFTLPIEDEPIAGENTWLDKGFTLTDSLISWCAQNEMYVILDLHAAPGGQGANEGISDYDSTKPSLWESEENRDKTVALWQRIAEHYADEQWVAGYDLLNETNWPMPGGEMLRTLYEEIVDSIRTVDPDHIIFIEGNWYANDFTGLTPPWFDNFVYSPHKYWSHNETEDLQWVLSLRDAYNVPLYFGESGENSNTWYHDAISNFESHGIGWAWWPMKKVESISGPLSITKTEDYQTLLNYWSSGSGTPPDATWATDVLMELTENLRLENCIYQKDVIDAMFRQVQEDTAIPYHTQAIPGIVQASDYDMGEVGVAYFDTDLATYHVSGGDFTAWNQGWQYRNDGVDIEPSTNTLNSNGYNVGWISTGEWMQYSVAVAQSAVYDVHVRVASTSATGQFHLEANGSPISIPETVINTGSFQTWETIVVEDVILSEADTKLRFYADNGGYNLAYLEFVQTGASTDIATDYLSATTIDEHTVQLNINKTLAAPIPTALADFTIWVNGTSINLTEAVLNAANTRIITFTTDHTFEAGETISISHTGDQIYAEDGTPLNTFTVQPVTNTIANIHPIPGKIEAEDFFYQLGMELEECTDIGGGQNLSYLDGGDYADYLVNVAAPGIYRIDYRTAAQSETGQIQLQKIETNGDVEVLHNVNFPPTGGWQVWETTSQNVLLEAGQQHFRVEIVNPLFNLNSFEFFSTTPIGINDHADFVDLQIFPNPNTGAFMVQGVLENAQNLTIQVINPLGQTVLSETTFAQDNFFKKINLTDVPNGNYWLNIRLENGTILRKQFSKMN